MEFNHGVLFSDTYQKKLKSQFYYADKDPQYGASLFFENSGGSLRLKKAVEAKAAIEEFPDCPERARGRGFDLADYVKNGTQEILEVIFGAKSGALITELTASQTMFHAVGTIMEGVDWGKNAVTSALEHPSAHDAVEYYCKKTGREFREVPANKVTGGLDPDEIMKYVDNIVSDAVQHAPHAVIDVEDWGVDVCNFAPYKFFGVRGCGYAYVSDRVAVMPHIKLTCKDDNVWALGTPAPANFAAMMAVIDYVCSIGKHFLGDSAHKYNKRELFVEGMNHIHLQERALLYRMLEGTDKVPGLRHIPGVQVYVDMEDLTYKDLIVAMGIEGIEFAECARRYLEHGVTLFERVKSSPYSKRIVETLGLEGALRVSPLHCHGTDDIDKFLKITKDIAEGK